VTGARPVRLAPVDLLMLGLLGIRIRRVRAALSVLGIAIGIATIVVVTGIPASGNQDLTNRITALGTNVLQAWPVQRQDTTVPLPEESVAMVGRIGAVRSATAVANTHTVVRRSDLIRRDDSSGLSVLASKLNLLGTVNGGLARASSSTRPPRRCRRWCSAR
jgi:putative ABC transport system permease protein